MKGVSKIKLAGYIVAGATIGLATQAWGVTGVCSNCHTMHNSQNGSPVVAAGNQNYLIAKAGGCLGCHQGANNVTAGALDNSATGVAANVPYVYTSGVTATNVELAAGNFGWAEGAGNLHKAHNVSDIAALDGGGVTVPPGYTGAGWTTQLSCAGATSGCHQGGAHHNNATGARTGATSVGESYRFLKAGSQADTPNYVSGYEDPNYEAEGVVTATAHNQYKGGTTTDSISSYCGDCHGNFHVTSGGSPWTYHPTDIDLNSLAAGTEYKKYNTAGALGRTYNPAVPVGSTDVSAPLGEVLTAAGDAYVTCVSCHRPHGTPNDYLLRFTYNMNAGSGVQTNEGCFVCHTTKDGVPNT